MTIQIKLRDGSMEYGRRLMIYKNDRAILVKQNGERVGYRLADIKEVVADQEFSL